MTVDHIGKHSIRGNLCLPLVEKSGNFMWSGKWSPWTCELIQKASPSVWYSVFSFCSTELLFLELIGQCRVCDQGEWGVTCVYPGWVGCVWRVWPGWVGCDVCDQGEWGVTCVTRVSGVWRVWPGWVGCYIVGCVTRVSGVWRVWPGWVGCDVCVPRVSGVWGMRVRKKQKNNVVPSSIRRFFQRHDHSSVFFSSHIKYVLLSLLSWWWLGGVVVSVSDSWSRGRRFDSWPLHCQATTLGKLFTPMCLCSLSSIIWHLVRAFMSTRLYVAAIHGSNEQGEYCGSGSAAIGSLRTAI